MRNFVMIIVKFFIIWDSFRAYVLLYHFYGSFNNVHRTFGFFLGLRSGCCRLESRNT